MQSASLHDGPPGRHFWQTVIRVVVAIEAAILVIVDAVVAFTLTMFFVHLRQMPDAPVLVVGLGMIVLSAMLAALLRKVWQSSPT